MAPASAYQKLKNRFQELYHLSGALSVLQWDRDVMMPSGAADQRAGQVATLATLSHSRLTAPEVADWLDEAQRETLSDWDAENLALMRHRHAHASALPAKLVYAFSEASNQCEHAWQHARKANDFALYLPKQQRVLQLVREVAQAKASALKKESLYDALLDEYDRGRTRAEIADVFAVLKRELPPMIQQAVATQPKKIPLPFDSGEVTKQRALCSRMMYALGLTDEHARLDTSAHPFSSGTREDVRITTRYGKDAWEGLMGVLHETGHALYEHQLPAAWAGQPVGEALGMSMHESQSLMMEMQMGRSREFFRYAFPIVCEVFGAVVPGEAMQQQLYRNYVRVEPGLIRVNADEMTYPLHVVLRFELEQELITGALDFADVPERWNAAMKEYLGLDVPNFAQGCMQDTHWAGGAFGYFPTYTLGAMHAAQFMVKAQQDVPTLLQHVEKGDFSPLVAWLRAHIHAQGSRYDAKGLLRHVTGAPLNVDTFLAHLRGRYQN